MITITDQNGASVTQAFDVYVLQSNPTGISVTVTALDVTAALSIEVSFVHQMKIVHVKRLLIELFL